MKHTLKSIKDKYKKVFYLEEDMILDVIVSVCIASKLPGDPIWLLIIGSPSSGKSAMLDVLTTVPFVHSVSSMTENTFLSNMRSNDGKENSLLHRIGQQGVLVMKDYTTILSMRAEKRDVIVSQMREIYDGKIVKEAGNGKSEKWEGKINWLGAVTESVYIKEDESAGMGRRTINYCMPIQDRAKTTQRAMKNNADIAIKRLELQQCFQEFILEMTDKLIDTPLPELPKDIEKELAELSDFITLVRTPTERNYRNELILVPSPEMPMRVFQMFATMAKIFMVLNDGVLSEDYRVILRRMALDSIPKQRRLSLSILASHKKITTKGAAQILRYPTETMRIWLENLNVLGVCERGTEREISGPDIWVMNEPFKSLMIKYDGIIPVDDDLVGASEIISGTGNEIQPTWLVGASDDPGVVYEEKQRADELFDEL